MIQTLPIAQFLPAHWQGDNTLIDVRSPQEFEKGHIPGAINIPLFDDNERALVGTLYKRKGRNNALLSGLDIVGPKLGQFVRELQNQSQTKEVLVHCWRGGMRSQSMGLLWQMAGFRVSTLEGGYKAYRHDVHACFGQKWNIKIIGGSTGTGKTDILHSLREAGAQVLDLEGLANHRGSTFGGLGCAEQPSVEQFENDCHEIMRHYDPSKPLWIEDESHAIGRVYVPTPLWEQMKVAPVYILDLPYDLRTERLIKEYGSYPKLAVNAALLRIKKRLGGKNYQDAIDGVEADDPQKVVALSLAYYDKAYSHGLARKDKVQKYHLSLKTDNPAQTAQLLLKQNDTQKTTE
ncbi:MAG: tRNA 2-selenouridine(34) synthase MnmH [Bacteroidia bacterium]